MGIKFNSKTSLVFMVSILLVSSALFVPKEVISGTGACNSCGSYEAWNIWQDYYSGVWSGSVVYGWSKKCYGTYGYPACDDSHDGFQTVAVWDGIDGNFPVIVQPCYYNPDYEVETYATTKAALVDSYFKYFTSHMGCTCTGTLTCNDTQG